MRRVFIFGLAAMILLSAAAAAADFSDGSVTIEGSTNYTPGNRYEAQMDVSLTLAENYQVTIPPRISLTSADGVNYSGSGTVYVSGLLGDNRYVDVLISSDSIQMSNGSSIITCSVTGEGLFKDVDGAKLVAKISNRSSLDENVSSYSNTLTYTASVQSGSNAGTYTGTQTFYIYCGDY